MRLILATVVALSIVSCRSPRIGFEEAFRCYDPIGGSAGIRTNGYFCSWDTIEYYMGLRPPTLIKDTVLRRFIFYEGGLFLYSYYPEQFADARPIGYSGGMSLWGGYSVAEDTIKAFFMMPPVSRPNRAKGFVWFKILDSTAVKEIGFKWREPITQEDLARHDTSRFGGKRLSRAVFTPSDSLPDPDKSWIMKEKWLWCDEQAYKNWQSARKAARK